ncbi:hypothetical protein [Sphingomonas sp. R86521]|uniref:hypothetical protein n=1 Tax=Sphingomonas sp. R86521 TaxID=3093860 RepID=UPI0036D3D9A2
MVRMGNVWDRTVEVLSGRAGMIATVALLGLFLPAVIRDTVVLYSVMASVVFAYLVVGSVLSVVALLFSTWAHLAIAAIATDPATTRAEAGRQARARLLPAFGITFLIGLVMIVALVPPILALAWSGFDFSLMLAEGSAASANMPSAGAAVFASLYVLILSIAILWVAARLVLLYPIILNERLGLGAIRRSIALTRGMTWRIIGVFVLFTIVVTIGTKAVQAVVGVTLGLVLGKAANFPTSVAVTLVSAGFTAVAAVFIARLYVASAGAPTSE